MPDQTTVPDDKFERPPPQLRNLSDLREDVCHLCLGVHLPMPGQDGTRFEKQPQQLGNFSGGLQIQEDVWTSSLLLEGSSSDARPKNSPARSNHGTSFEL